jgi:hypothetical protein
MYYSPDVPHYMGLTMYNHVSKGKLFVSGASIGLSREALRQLASLYDPDSNTMRNCTVGPGGDDTGLAECLLQIGITPENTMDEFGGHRFTAFFQSHVNLTKRIPQGHINNCMTRKPTPRQDTNICSDRLIAVHRPYKNVDDSTNREWFFLHRYFNSLPSGLPVKIPMKPALAPWDSSLFKHFNHTVTLVDSLHC